MKVLKLAIAISLLANASVAMAHFKIGNYKGTYASGTECAFSIKAVHFKNDLKHPLNEQVMIEIDEQEYEFIHLAIVEDNQLKVRPKKEILSTVEATNYGAVAYEMHMNEQGPFKMVFTSDNYKNKEESFKLTCGNLKYLGE